MSHTHFCLTIWKWGARASRFYLYKPSATRIMSSIHISLSLNTCTLCTLCITVPACICAIAGTTKRASCRSWTGSGSYTSSRRAFKRPRAAASQHWPPHQPTVRPRAMLSFVSGLPSGAGALIAGCSVNVSVSVSSCRRLRRRVRRHSRPRSRPSSCPNSCRYNCRWSRNELEPEFGRCNGDRDCDRRRHCCLRALLQPLIFS